MTVLCFEPDNYVLQLHLTRYLKTSQLQMERKKGRVPDWYSYI